MLDSLDTLIAFVLIMLVVSLLITIAVQIASSLLNLRGVNLASALASTFAVIAPSIEENRRELVRFVLKGRFLSDSFLPNWLRHLPFWLTWWRYASAIRPAEVFDAIHRIASGKEPVAKDPTHPTDSEQAVLQSARKILIELGVTEETIDAAETAEQATQDLIAAANEGLKSLPKADQDKLQVALKTVSDRLLAAEQAVAAQVATVAGKIDVARQRFEDWTCIAQQRAQQWLTMHTRILTIIFAFAFAFWLQLDTVEIFKLVSSNKAVRDKLVAQAGTVEAQAARVLGDSSSVLKDALTDWREKQTDQAIKDALKGIEVKDTDAREEVQAKVAKALEGKTPIDSFDSIVNTTATQRLEKQAGNFKAVKADFEKTGFDLFPTDNKFRWGKAWCDRLCEHLAGLLFSVGLLSLGAPFWYHILKDLVSLRSKVAENITKEQERTQTASATS
jgi:hypothetical protein